MKQPHRHTPWLFTLLGIAALLLFATDLATGDSLIPLSQITSALTGGDCDETTRNIVLSIRFPRVVVAALIGIALSVSGLQMQTVFQNPLADPYLLGVSSGAGLGVALFILGAPLLGWNEIPWLQSMGIIGSGWIGTAVILLGVALISRKVNNILGVLIMGVMIGYVAGAIIQILQYLSSAEQLNRHADCRVLHQTAQPAAAGRALCTHHGNEPQTVAYPDFPLHGTADRLHNCFLRTGGIHRTGCTPHCPPAFQQRRPPHTDAGHPAHWGHRHVDLRYHSQAVHAPYQLHHGTAGRSSHLMGYC